MDDKFYAVWRENNGGSRPRRHEDLESAKNDAARLARQERARYFVMEVIGVVELSEAPVEYREI